MGQRRLLGFLQVPALSALAPNRVPPLPSPPGCPGGVSLPEALPGNSEPPLAPTYLVELVEESGSALLRATYWDLGEWSDINRQFKPVPENVTFEVC